MTVQEALDKNARRHNEPLEAVISMLIDQAQNQQMIDTLEWVMKQLDLDGPPTSPMMTKVRLRFKHAIEMGEQNVRRLEGEIDRYLQK